MRGKTKELVKASSSNVDSRLQSSDEEEEGEIEESESQSRIDTKQSNDIQ